MKNFSKETWIIGLLFGFFFLLLIASAFRENSAKIFNHQALSKDNGIAVIYLYQSLMIDSSSSFASDSGVEGAISTLKNLEKNKSVKALILRINSPGGTVGASQELYNAVMRFKKKTNLPVIVSIGDIGTSGAYWVASAGDVIFANPGSLVGSIGVIMKTYDLSEIQKRYGVGLRVYKSVEHKDFLSEWRKPSSEESAIVNDMLDDIQNQFSETIKKRRHLSQTEILNIADGRIFTGRQALDARLIDKLGSYQEALDYATATANIQGEPEIISHEASPFSLLKKYIRAESSFFSIQKLISGLPIEAR